MPEQEKSIFDYVEIKEEVPGEARHVVSKCPDCGAPIYGPKWTTSETPNVVFSCDCRQSKTIQESMQTK